MTAVEVELRPDVSVLRLRYDTERFPFAALLASEVFGVSSLSALHRDVIAARRARRMTTELRTRDNLAARSLMQQLPDDAPFFRLYHEFMRVVLAPIVGRPLSYSNRPKARVHFPGTRSVSSFHHDVPVTKRPDQLNFWMPFTDVADSAALQVESDYGRADYAPVPLRYGQVMIFDGGYLGHGSIANDTSRTRISCDMRFGYRGATTRADSVALMNHLAMRLRH